MLPVVVIAGRPNVGKSTLFNRLSGRRSAIVSDTPGVTRDRKDAEAMLRGRNVRLVDTAGLEESDPEAIYGRMRASSEAAVAEADLIVFVIDARAGVTPADAHFARWLRRHGRLRQVRAVQWRIVRHPLGVEKGGHVRPEAGDGDGRLQLVFRIGWLEIEIHGVHDQDAVRLGPGRGRHAEQRVFPRRMAQGGQAGIDPVGIGVQQRAIGRRRGGEHRGGAGPKTLDPPRTVDRQGHSTNERA